MNPAGTASTQLKNVGEALRARRAANPDEPLVNIGGPWVTCQELDERSDRVAAGLARLGVTPGDRVAWIMPNRIEIAEVMFGIAKIGAVQVPLNPFLKGEFLAYQLRDAAATVLITDAAGYRAASALLSTTDIKDVVLLDNASDLAVERATLTYEELKSGEEAPPDVSVSLGDLFSIIYTSGTTGPPKGCMIPHGYYVRAGIEFGKIGMIVPGDRLFSAFPLFHVGGQAIPLLGSVINNASTCFQTTFSASDFMPRMRAEGATVTMGVGAIAMAILATPPSPEDKNNRIRRAGFGPLSIEKQREFEERFGLPPLSLGYGQTESILITQDENYPEEKRTTIGRALPHLDVRIVDDRDEEVPRGVVGEIVVRPREPGPSTMFLGYWGKPEATLDASRNLWHHTGDSATMDDDGYVTFVDRKKDALRRRGENVSSFELEAAILAHPAVAHVAVCAVHADFGDDDIKACLVLEPDSALTPGDFFDFVKDRVPYFAVPRYVQLRESLPITGATHRVQKHVLRDEGITDDCWDLEKLGFSVDKTERRG